MADALHLVRSSAVMARRVEPADSLDFFPTPPWGSRALTRRVLPMLGLTIEAQAGLTAWDPCCGEGHMSQVLGETFGRVYQSDVHDYGQAIRQDFLAMQGFRADWIVMNPPFNRILPFIRHALALAERGVAVLARSAVLEGQERWHRLYADLPPTLYCPFVERLSMSRGRWAVNTETATAYAWLVWDKDRLADPDAGWVRHIPPCKRELSQPDDWLRFRACSDLPKTHKVMRGSSDA